MHFYSWQRATTQRRVVTPFSAFTINSRRCVAPTRRNGPHLRRLHVLRNMRASSLRYRGEALRGRGTLFPRAPLISGGILEQRGRLKNTVLDYMPHVRMLPTHALLVGAHPDLLGDDAHQLHLWDRDFLGHGGAPIAPPCGWGYCAGYRGRLMCSSATGINRRRLLLCRAYKVYRALPHKDLRLRRFMNGPCGPLAVLCAARRAARFIKHRHTVADAFSRIEGRFYKAATPVLRAL